MWKRIATCSTLFGSYHCCIYRKELVRNFKKWKQSCFYSGDWTGKSFCRYNPNKYDDYGDDSDMEANFDDIMREEKRRFSLFLCTCRLGFFFFFSHSDGISIFPHTSYIFSMSEPLYPCLYTVQKLQGRRMKSSFAWLRKKRNGSGRRGWGS